MDVHVLTSQTAAARHHKLLHNCAEAPSGAEAPGEAQAKGKDPYYSLSFSETHESQKEKTCTTLYLLVKHTKAKTLQRLARSCLM